MRRTVRTKTSLLCRSFLSLLMDRFEDAHIRTERKLRHQTGVFALPELDGAMIASERDVTVEHGEVLARRKTEA